MGLPFMARCHWVVPPPCPLLTGVRSDPKSVLGSNISTVLVGDTHVFTQATQIILADDTHSLRLRFNVALGDTSKYQDDHAEEDDDKLPEALEMEGQGILVRDDHKGNPTHVCPIISIADI
jgi:hypothetical protein